MPTFHRPADLVRYQESRFRKMKLDRERVHRELVQQSISDHYEYTQGSISTKALAEMGHPFGRSGAGARGVKAAKRKKFAGAGAIRGYETDKAGRWKNSVKPQVNSRGAVNPLPINRQTGKLRKSLRVTGPSGPLRIYRAGFTAEYAGFVLSPKGTSKMVARGFYSQGNSVAGMGIIARNHKARLAALARVIRNRS